MQEFSKYVGLDTHKDSIAVAVAVSEACSGQSRYYGEHAGGGGQAGAAIESG